MFCSMCVRPRWGEPVEAFELLTTIEQATAELEEWVIRDCAG